MPFTANFLTNIALAKEKMASADAVLVGAGAGLSTAAGLVYDGPDFKKNFADFIAKYHFPNLYYGGFGPFENDQEMWAYWSRFVAMERYEPGPLPLYQELLSLLAGKNYFVLTTNVDHCFQKRDSIKNACSTPKATMVSFNAVGLATIKPMTMKRRLRRC